MPVAERREQLIEAALRVASRDGIDAATVRAVAAEAGVSLGVVHYCFLDKGELLRAVADAITAQNLQAVIGEVPEGLSLPTLLELAIDGLWQGMAQNRGNQLLSYELTTSSLRHADLSQVAIEQYRGSWAAVEVFLERIEHGASIAWTIPRADLARTVVALVDGYALAWLTDGDDNAAVRGLRTFATFLASQAVHLDEPPPAPPHPFAGLAERRLSTGPRPTRTATEQAVPVHASSHA